MHTLPTSSAVEARMMKPNLAVSAASASGAGEGAVGAGVGAAPSVATMLKSEMVTVNACAIAAVIRGISTGEFSNVALVCASATPKKETVALTQPANPTPPGHAKGVGAGVGAAVGGAGVGAVGAVVVVFGAGVGAAVGAGVGAGVGAVVAHSAFCTLEMLRESKVNAPGVETKPSFAIAIMAVIYA